MLEERGRATPKTPTLFAPERLPLDYSTLYAHLIRTAAPLARFGIERDDIVAVVLPNGPEMASAFLSVTAVAICAPLSPAYPDPRRIRTTFGALSVGQRMVWLFAQLDPNRVRFPRIP